MNKQGFLISLGSSHEYFTTTSAYDRPQWVALSEATVFPTADMAHASAKKLWQYGAYSASPISVTEALDDLALDDEDELDPSLEGLPPEDVDLLSQPGDESGYGADGELDGEGIPAIDGDESGYGADGELDGEGVPAMDGEDDLDVELSIDGEDDLGDESGYGADGELDVEGVPAMDDEGGNFELSMPDEDENDENAVSPIELNLLKGKRTNEAVDHNGDRVFQTYAAWKRAVKAIDPSAEFYGDKDIGGAKGVGEWDGETGLIFAKALRDEWASKKTNESIITELSKNTLKSYLNKAIKSTKKLVDDGDMVKGVSRAKKAAWASGKLKEKMYEADTTVKTTDYKDRSTECKNTPSEYTNAPGCDKVKVPGSITSALKAVVTKFKQSAERSDTRNDVSSSQDLTVADAMQQLIDDLSAGTLEGMQQAQIHMTSYMTPITQHIPADVVKFIAKGGKQESLSNMFASMKESKKLDFDTMSDIFHTPK